LGDRQKRDFGFKFDEALNDHVAIVTATARVRVIPSLFNIIGGLLDEYNGNVMIERERIAGPHKAVGMVFQEESTFPWRNVIDNVAFPLELQGVNKSERIDRAFADRARTIDQMRRFVGDASHELRTPLTVIKGYVEMLSKNQLTQETDKARAFDRVSTEINRMESLVRDLLLLAELGESGARDIEVVDFSEIVRAHGTDFLTLNAGRSVQLAIEPEIFIDASRDYIARFIQNALTNIVRHTAKDDAVKISLTRQGRSAQLMIEDAGPGLPESGYREDIRSLNRFDKSRSRDNGGSGLGMSIMSAVITKLDGTFSLRKSTLGGLAIVVELPVAKD
jgi:signal transduction histidine kinase